MLFEVSYSLFCVYVKFIQLNYGDGLKANELMTSSKLKQIIFPRQSKKKGGNGGTGELLIDEHGL